MKESLFFPIRSKNRFPHTSTLASPPIYCLLLYSLHLFNPIILLWHAHKLLPTIRWWRFCLFSSPIFGYINGWHKNLILFGGYPFRNGHVLYTLIFCLLFAPEFRFVYLGASVLAFVDCWGFIYGLMFFFEKGWHGFDILLLFGDSGDGTVVFGEGGNGTHSLFQDSV